MQKLYKLLQLFFAGIGMLVVASSLLFILFSLAISGESAIKKDLRGEYLSPDKAYITRHTYYMSGGAAGSCNHVVTVESLLSQEANEKKHKTDTRVLDADCGVWVSVNWIGPADLSVRYGFKRDARLMMRKMNTDKNVSIHFEQLNEMPSSAL